MSFILSCTGISKTFTRSISPEKTFQDALLQFGKRKKQWSVHAVNDISFSVRHGEWIGITGPNGSGKTTLLRLVAGLLEPDTGTVSCHGTLSCFFGLGAGFHPERTAHENIRIHGILHGMSFAQIREYTHRIIEFADISSHTDVPLKCYSKGMRARLAFAATAFVDADVYVFDEVVAVGDSVFKEKCKNHFNLLKNSGKSAIIASHTLQGRQGICERILCLQNGSLIMG